MYKVLTPNEEYPIKITKKLKKSHMNMNEYTSVACLDDGSSNK